jgi:fructose-bisphosphate aldolase class II
MLVSMEEMLKEAGKGRYAVGFFNAVNVEMARAVIETAEELKAPVIIGTAEVLLPAMPLERVAEYLIPMAKKAGVPVAVHYDHGLTFEKCMEALKLGFTSIMYDCSTADYETNAAKVAEMVRICHAMNVTVEGELGHVGDNEGAGKLENPSDYFTDPEIAADFVGRTGIDSLAVAVGNAHGDYKFPPKLDFDRLTEIRSRVEIPLVLHGASDVPDELVQKAISLGICKVNVATDLKIPFSNAARSGTFLYLGSVSSVSSSLISVQGAIFSKALLVSRLKENSFLVFLPIRFTLSIVIVT